MASPTPPEIDATRLFQRASTVFTPAVPISKESLFAGRVGQVSKLVDAINQPGQHAVLFGERGVGKTSLANVLGERWQGLGYILAPRVGCLSTDDWPQLWVNALREITMTTKDPRAGFRGGNIDVVVHAASSLPEDFGMNDVRASVTTIGRNAVLVIIFDEFDTLHAEARKALAETVKFFSDYSVPVTLILVGVADSVGQLLRDHQSIERALIQVQMPRMSDDELNQILANGLTALGMTMKDQAKRRIVNLSRGLPHYTHLLGLYATRVALGRSSLDVNGHDVTAAITVALDNSQQSTKDAYSCAIASSQRAHLFRQVLLACALAEANEFGFFTASAVSAPLSKIMGKRYDVPSYARHLTEFCGEKREHILERTGDKRSYRYRFRNPLMQPYVILNGYSSKMISEAAE
jgi:AAA domain